MINQPESIHLVYALDEYYAFPTMVSATSAAYLTTEKLIIHLIDLGLTDEQFDWMQTCIHRINPETSVVRHRLPRDFFSAFRKWKGSTATYARILTCTILHDIDWAIFFDGDTLWTRDLKNLWALKDESLLLLGSVDNRPQGEIEWFEQNNLQVEQYFCAGLMLMNLKLMRKMNIAEKCMQFIESHNDVPTVDQTALNVICSGKIRLLPIEWGVFSMGGGLNLIEDPSDIGSIHYVADLPWKRPRRISLITDVVNCWWFFVRRILKMPWSYATNMSVLDWAFRRMCFRVLCVVPFLYAPTSQNPIYRLFFPVLGRAIYRCNPRLFYHLPK